MRIIPPEGRPKPFVSSRTHARLRHDFATWHEDHRVSVVAKSSPHLPYEDRSKFDSYAIALEAIAHSSEHPAMVGDGANQNRVVVFDLGYEVGYDARARRRTSAVTVVMTALGEVITAHPGTPWSKDHSEY